LISNSTCPRKCFLATEYTEKHGRIQKNKEKTIRIFLYDFHSRDFSVNVRAFCGKKSSVWTVGSVIFFQPGDDPGNMVRFVGEGAIRAALDGVRVAGGFKISAALIAQKIERAIAKQAVESLGIATQVAGKIAAFDVSEKLVAVVHRRFPYQPYY